MKCEHDRVCDNCKLDGSRDCCGCFNGLDHRKFSCKLCKEKCENEKGCKNCNNNAFAVKPNMEKCIGCVSPEYKNFERTITNKPLTIAELEQMDGLPVWMVIPLIKANKSEWVLVNVTTGGVYDYEGGIYFLNNFNNDNICCYKEKPSPRMATTEEVIKEGLLIKHIDSDNLDFMRCVFASILDKGIDYGGRLKVNVTDVQELLLNAVWEVKED